MCVYTNTGCFCGNYLSVSKVRALPSQLGPASLSRVLMETVQSCINCAVDERKVYNLVKEGSSKVCITGQSGHSLHHRLVWSWSALQVSLQLTIITGQSISGLITSQSGPSLHHRSVSSSQSSSQISLQPSQGLHHRLVWSWSQASLVMFESQVSLKPSHGLHHRSVWSWYVSQVSLVML